MECENPLEIIIRIVRDDTGTAGCLSITHQGRELESLSLRPNQQLVWRCLDDRYRGAHLEIRLDPKFSPFAGHRYEIGVGRSCPSGPMNERIAKLARHRSNCIALVTTVDGHAFAKSFEMVIRG
ncbi:MAG TPA: hypothetical protein VJ302_05145 [Blastocatellia bacterium]|nr:hypothetical protein [Blastocatellia bacterium]